MPEAVNRQFLLAARPHGMVKASDFEYREVAVPTPGPGEALIKPDHISLAPSKRG
ncbi:MAG: NADP-dependent oxidoreductase, partial [Gammaproteobacteria bacterium]|nr:NADP-dependent oxidoreductase [Gammaproteobacteria bacterium]